MSSRCGLAFVVRDRDIGRTTVRTGLQQRQPTTPRGKCTACRNNRSRDVTTEAFRAVPPQSGSAGSGTVSPLRRVPVQGRSVARVARMLDACAELVDEMGYEALTTTLLAERAGVA